MSVTKKNTYITDLEPGDLIIEYKRTTGLQYISTVKSINNDVIVVTRNTDGQDYSYFMKSGREITKRDEIFEFFLLQYVDPSSPTPFNPGELSEDAEELIDDYGGL